MMTNIFDTHAHYDDEQFNEDRSALLSSLKNKGVSGVINCATTPDSARFTIELCKKYDFIYAAVGLHPENMDEVCENDLSLIRELAESEKKIVAIGEIGLDYYWDTSLKDKQLEFFERQIILANELDLPVIVHDREAHADTLALLKKHKPKGVLHCFSGSVETAEEILSLGMYIGIGGAVTFKNAKKPVEVVRIVPDDRLLLETDCPYMSPVPFRGKRNDSSLIAHTAQRIAEIRETDAQHLIDRCTENAKKLFGIS